VSGQDADRRTAEGGRLCSVAAGESKGGTGKVTATVSPRRDQAATGGTPHNAPRPSTTYFEVSATSLRFAVQALRTSVLTSAGNGTYSRSSAILSPFA